MNNRKVDEVISISFSLSAKDSPKYPLVLPLQANLPPLLRKPPRRRRRNPKPKRKRKRNS